MPGIISAGAIFYPQQLEIGLEGAESATIAAETAGDVANTLTDVIPTVGDVSTEAALQVAGEAQQFTNIFGSTGELGSIYETSGEAISGAALSEEVSASFTSIGEKMGDAGAATDIEKIVTEIPTQIVPVETSTEVVTAGDITSGLEAEIPGGVETTGVSEITSDLFRIEGEGAATQATEAANWFGEVGGEIGAVTTGSNLLGDISRAITGTIMANKLVTGVAAVAVGSTLFLLAGGGGAVSGSTVTDKCKTTGSVTNTDKCCEVTDSTQRAACEAGQTYVAPTTTTSAKDVCDSDTTLTPDQKAMCKTCNASIGATAADIKKNAVTAKGTSLINCLNAAIAKGTATKDVCDRNGLTGTQLAACKSCLSTLNLAGKSTLGGTEMTAVSSCLQCMTVTNDTVNDVNVCVGKKGTTPGTTPVGGTTPGGGTTGDVCDLSGLTGTQLAACKSCLSSLNLAGLTTITAEQKAAITACMSAGGGTTPTTGTKDVCDLSGLVDTQLTNCKSCLNTLNLAGKTTVTAEQITNIQSCMKSGASASTTTTPETTATEAAAMATAKATGQDPCSAAGLRASVQAACKQCYQTGMSDTQLVTCVNGKLAAQASPVAAVTATLQKYAIPIVLGVAVVGGVAYATHGKYWGKKGPGKPVPAPIRAKRR